MFFSAGQVSKSFSRLKGRKRTDGKTTKTHLEKTSALMCFLAFDATCKITQSEKLDLNPTSDHGKKIRGLIAAEFSKLVLLTGESDNKLQFIELGKVVQQNKSPEVRFSSNFLTVPLKKASEQAAPYSYPNRPRNAEVLKRRSGNGLQVGNGVPRAMVVQPTDAAFRGARGNTIHGSRNTHNAKHRDENLRLHRIFGRLIGRAVHRTFGGALDLKN